jgi:adenosylcobinamide-GDP ribazoletransferase
MLAIAALVIGTVLALAALGPGRGALAIALAGSALLGSGVMAQRRIGGYTGDVLGAFQQIAEIVMLLTSAAR